MIERRWSVAVLLTMTIVAAACSPGDEADDCVRTTDPDHSVARVWNEPFEDTNKNGKWDEGEKFTDLNKDGTWSNGPVTPMPTIMTAT